MTDKHYADGTSTKSHQAITPQYQITGTNNLFYFVIILSNLFNFNFPESSGVNLHLSVLAEKEEWH